MRTNVKKIAMGGLLIAFAILIPQAFHLSGIPKSGQIFLPMHIPVLIGGFVLGPLFGAIVGLVSPIISTMITGMPDMSRLPFMMLELCSYALAAGVMYNALGFRKRKFGAYISLVTAMIAGRLVYALSLLTASQLLGIECGGIMAAVNATVSGIIGIAIQLVFIPPVIYALERSGYIDRHFRTGISASV